MAMIYTHHPRSRFERRMHRRRELRAHRVRDRNHPYPALRRSLGHRAVRRRMRQGWSYYLVHCLACGPDVGD